MKSNLTALAALVALAGATVVARADDAPAAPAAPAAAPASPIAYNIGLVSDYRYRGVSQSRLDPALQGGIDYTNPNGPYLGTWLSTISWIKDGGTEAGVDSGKTPAEWDLYGGFRGNITKDLSFDVGGLYYLYVGNKYANVGANANTFEIYGQLGYGIFTAKYSDSLTNLFGTANSKNSGYLDLTANVDLGNGLSLAPELSYQSVAHNSRASYSLFTLTLGKDFGNGFSVSAAAILTDVKKTAAGAYLFASPSGKNEAGSTLVLGAKYTF